MLKKTNKNSLSPPLFSFDVSPAPLLFSQSTQPLLPMLSPPQRCSVCCSWTCWCSCRSRTIKWSSNATARVTSPCRRASRCWVQLSSWTRSSCVRWPQVSRPDMLSQWLPSWHQCGPTQRLFSLSLAARSKGLLCYIHLGQRRSDLWTGGSVCWGEKIVGSRREHDCWLMC